MANTMIYTCDICKQSKSKNDLAHLSVTVKGIVMKDYNRYTPLQIDICPDCLRKKGFVVDYKEKEEQEQVVAQNSATLQDKIYDILYDLGVMFER